MKGFGFKVLGLEFSVREIVPVADATKQIYANCGSALLWTMCDSSVSRSQPLNHKP